MEIIITPFTLNLTAGVAQPLHTTKRALSATLSCPDDFSIGNADLRAGALRDVELAQVTTESGGIARYDLKEIWVESAVATTITVFLTEVKSVD